MEKRENLYASLQVLEPAGKIFTKEERIAAMEGPLLAWYDKNARDLPWRRDPEPYRVWISEIMLQQTRVEAVKPYFERFMKELPDVDSLANVKEERLFKLWEGLGYYSRAKNLKKAAVEIEEKYGGKIPADYKILLSLPGIGSYTAGAIASFAFQIPVPAVDGNVLRVVSRLTASREDILKQSVKKKMEKLLTLKMSKDRPGDFNQALIELGALVCIPGGEPRCSTCPLKSLCLAAREGLTGEIPVRTPKKARRIEKKTVFLIEHGKEVAVRKRPDQGLLAGLYEYPNVDGWLSGDEAKEWLAEQGACAEEILLLKPVTHVYSHVEWRMRAYAVKIEGNYPENMLFVDEERMNQDITLPSAFEKVRQEKNLL